MNEYLNLLEFIEHLKLNMVLNNNIVKYSEFELINQEKLFENVGDIYQYFIIDGYEVDYWLNYTGYPLYYSDELDIYLVGINHFGMGWDYFDTTYPRP